MEYVKGAPIDAYVETQALGPQAIVRLMIAVCDGVQYAHQNLVVHADIKPSNILVTDEGEPRIVDFGVSALLSAPGAAGASRPRGFTPGYSSPERISGAPPAPTEDVYSLGIVLRSLVSGSHPGAEAWNKPIEALIDASFADHSSAWRRARRREVRGDLARIIARATSASREQRYQSVEAFRNDLEAWLGHRPIASMRSNRLHVLSLLVRRRRLRFIFAGFAVVGVITALVVSTSLYLSAETQRRAAEKRFGEVRELASFMLFDLYDDLAKTVGNTTALERIANKSLTYLQSLDADPTAPLEVKLDVASGYQRLADVLGNPNGPNLGARATATSMLDGAIAALEKLYALHPDNRVVMTRLAEATFSGATNAYVSDDDNDKARKLALRAGEIYAALAALPGGTIDDQRNVLRSRLMAAVPLPWVGKSEEGVAELKAVREQAAALLATHEGNTDIEQFLGSVDVELARAIIRWRDATGKDAPTLDYWDNAVAIRERAHARNPDDIRPYRNLATILYERGAERRTSGLYDAALEDMDAAMKVADDLLAKDPDDTGLRRLKGGIMDETAKSLAFAGRYPEAIALVAQARPVSEREHAEHAGNAGIAREYAYSLALYADVYRMAGRRSEACDMLTKAKRAWAEAESLQGLSERDQQTSASTLGDIEGFCQG
jgi:serine/threonine-protein kinase